MAENKGTDKLIERIIESANESADEIIKNAKVRAAAIISEADSTVASIRMDGETAAQRYENDILMRTRTNAELDAKKSDLHERHGVIDMAFDDAYRRLEMLSGDECDVFMRKLLLKEASGGEVIHPSVKHGKNIEKILSEVNAELLKAGKKPLTVGAVCELKNGFELEGDGYTKSCSFAALLEEFKEANLSAVADILFA